MLSTVYHRLTKLNNGSLREKDDVERSRTRQGNAREEGNCGVVLGII